MSRLISAIERGGEEAQAVLARLWPHTGKAKVIGVTGPPGAGKSTMTDKLAKHWRAKGLRVGIVAVDPTSPFTGGAILGDRVRMGDLTLDEGVFIRSMGTRGPAGRFVFRLCRRGQCAGRPAVMMWSLLKLWAWASPRWKWST